MSAYKNETTEREGALRQIKTALAAVTGPNRAHFARELRRRENKGNKASTRLGALQALRLFDEGVGHKDLLECTTDDLAAGVAHLRSRVQASTVGTYMVHVRTLLKELHDTDRLPRSVRSATHAPDKPTFRQGKVLADTEFRTILEYIHSRGSHNGVLDRRPELLAIAWTLRDAGLRARELLAMEIRGVDLRPDGSGILCLPHKPELRHMLKTGPRDVPIRDAVGPLQAWLDLHPAAGEPGAPLFCGLRSRSGLERLGYGQLYKQVKTWGRETGIDLRDRRDRTLRPHDFRHTCATMKVRVNGWQEQELRAFFGWAPASKMPARYVHLEAEDLRKRVLRDRGINDFGMKDAGLVASSEDQIKAVLRRLLLD